MPTQKLSTGIDLYYETHGKGEPVYLIPGTGSAGNVWEWYQVPALSKHYQVVIMDTRGTGRSSAPPGNYTMEQLACDIAALMDHLGHKSAHLIGHSMGGRISMALALSYPLRVRSLVLAASGSGPASRTGPDCIPGLPFYLVSELVEKGYDEWVRSKYCDSSTWFTPDFRAKHPDKVRAFYDMVWSQHAKWRPYLQICLARHNWEGTYRLGDIAVPTLVVCGDADTADSNHLAQAEAMAARIPNSEYQVIKDQTHGFFWQAPDESNAVMLDWLRRH